MPIVEQPHSRLLSLPAELRNAIYELVAIDIKKAFIVVTADGTPQLSDVQHPLSRTCRQVRKEFASCAVDAARYACLELRCRNSNLPPCKLVRELLRSLSPLGDYHFDPTHRCYSQLIFIDNDFDFNLTNKIKDVLGGHHGNTDIWDFRIVRCKA